METDKRATVTIPFDEYISLKKEEHVLRLHRRIDSLTSGLTKAQESKFILRTNYGWGGYSVEYVAEDNEIDCSLYRDYNTVKAELDTVKAELDSIKSKWYYKLFNTKKNENK